MFFFCEQLSVSTFHCKNTIGMDVQPSMHIANQCQSFSESNEVENSKQCHMNLCNKLGLSKFQHRQPQCYTWKPTDLWRKSGRNSKTEIDESKAKEGDKNHRFYSANFYFNKVLSTKNKVLKYYPLHFFLIVPLFLHFLHIFAAALSIDLLLNIYEKYTTAVVTHHTEASLFRIQKLSTILPKMTFILLLFVCCPFLFCKSVCLFVLGVQKRIVQN